MKITDNREKKTKVATLKNVGFSVVFEYFDRKPSWARSMYTIINHIHEHYLPNPGPKYIWVFDLKRQTVCRHQQNLRVVALESEFIINGEMELKL